MLQYIARRLLWLPFLLLIVAAVTYVLGVYGPGDPVVVMLGRNANPEAVARIRHERGLDRPFHVQFGDYLWKAAHGDLGISFKFQGEPVGQLIGRKVWISAQLGLAAMVLAIALGVPLGLLAAMKQGTWVDTAIVSFTLIFMSLPIFVLAPSLVIFFSLWLHILPTSGWGGLFDTRIIMPALVLALPSLAGLTRMMRASTQEVLGQDYVRTARAKGLTELLVRRRHILRNALIPIFTVLGLSLGTIVTGAFVTETLFGIPGVGRLGVDSIFARDYPIIMALTLLVAFSFVLANLIVDIGYTFLDPRIRLR